MSAQQALRTGMGLLLPISFFSMPGCTSTDLTRPTISSPASSAQQASFCAYLLAEVRTDTITLSSRVISQLSGATSAQPIVLHEIQSQSLW